MEFKYRLISADSHAAFDRDAFTSRMSAKWGDRIPRVVEVEHDGRSVHRWTYYGNAPRPEGSGVCNCPALMEDRSFPHFPQRWEEVPRAAFDPQARLEALDIDGVDAEVLFHGPDVYEFRDADFELDFVRVANDAMGEWTQVSDRYLPLAQVPWLSGAQAVAREIGRAVVECGHRGVHLHAQTPRPLPHLGDPYWDPVWAVCQELGVPVNFHGSAGLDAGVGKREARWRGYSPRQGHSAHVTPSCVTPAQVIPHLIFSGITERFPNLNFVFAESGIGGLTYALATCDHEWESRHLWTEGIATRPSDTIARQIYLNFWYEAAAPLLHHGGVDNIMWESDLPHIPCFYPKSREAAERVLEGVPTADRRKLLYENAARLYRLQLTGLAAGKPD